MPPRAHSVKPIKVKVEFSGCPVEASLGVLGRKWALLILRNIALYRANRFNAMIRATPGLTKRILSMRLRELEGEAFIVRVERSDRYARWALTEKGIDVLPVLLTLVQLGSKWYPDRVFRDGTPRALTEIFEREYVRETLSPRPPAARFPPARRAPAIFDPVPRPMAATPS